jgi:hypothetical protein
MNKHKETKLREACLQAGVKKEDIDQMAKDIAELMKKFISSQRAINRDALK